MKKNKILSLIMAGAIVVPIMAGASNVTAHKTLLTKPSMVSTNENYGCAKSDTNILNAQGKVIGKVSTGEMLVIENHNDGQVSVKSEKTGLKGYINTNKIISITAGNASNIETMNKSGHVVNVDTVVNLRNMPTMKSSVENTLTNGTSLNILGKTGNWYKVSVDGQKGFIFCEYVQEGSQTLGIKSVNSDKATNEKTNTSNNVEKTTKESSSVVSSHSKAEHNTVKYVNNSNNIVSNTEKVTNSSSQKNVENTSNKKSDVIVNSKTSNNATTSNKEEGTVIINNSNKHNSSNVVVENNTTNKKENSKVDNNKEQNVVKPVKPVEKTSTAYATVNVYVNPQPKVTETHNALLTKGEKVTLIGNSENGWYKVKTSNGVEGYVSSKYVSSTKPSTEVKPSVDTNKGKTPIVKPDVVKPTVNTDKDKTPVVKPDVVKPNVDTNKDKTPVVKPDVVKPNVDTNKDKTPVVKPDTKPVEKKEIKLEQAKTQQLWTAYNEYRVQHGMKALKWSDSLQTKTDKLAKSMATKEDAWHEYWGACAEQVTGYNSDSSMTGNAILNQFLSDQAHKDALSSKSSTEGSCAVYQGKDGAIYFVVSYNLVF